MRQRLSGIFVAAMFFGCAGASAQETVKKTTAQEVVDAIKGHVGVEWREKTVDTFKTGDPQTVVTGVAVTMMATMAKAPSGTMNGLWIRFSMASSRFGSSLPRLRPGGPGKGTRARMINYR